MILSITMLLILYADVC